MYDPCFVILTGCAPGGFWLVDPFNDAGKAIEYATEHAECHYYDDVDDYWEVYTCVKPSIPYE